MGIDMTSPTHSSQRINRIAAARGAQSYLEIGVQHGRTFRNVRIGRRVGVDPHFGFDVAAVEDGTTRLFAIASDAYFSTLAVDAMFDIVFIDGLHTFEQTYRDFCNVLVHTHRGSVIIIDDTWPVDEFSALRDPQEAVARRAQAGGSGNAWHGDVFKVIFAIREFHPSVEYATIMTRGNPQTMVWRRDGGQRRVEEPNHGEVPCDTFEAIERMSYSDLLAHEQALHPMSEQEALALVGAGTPNRVRALRALGARWVRRIVRLDG